MKKLLALSLILALTGCGTTSGLVGEMPPVKDQATASKVVPIRISSIVGVGNGYTVVFDGKDLLGIGSGEHAEFYATPGKHTIGVKCFGGWTPTWKEDALEFNATSKTTSYFEISPSGRCASIRQLEEPNAQELLKKSKEINLFTNKK